VASRPNMTLAVKRLIRDLAQRLPELAHVRASRVLVVAGEARGSSRATIRPGRVVGARRGRFMRVRGRRILYVITLRPLWFAASTPEDRIATILHELYHASTHFDGSLHAGRRHSRLPRGAYDRRVKLLLGRYLARAPAELLAPFAGEGEVRVRMWLRGPPSKRDGVALDVDEQLFHGFLPLRSRPLPRPRQGEHPPEEKAGPSAPPPRKKAVGRPRA